MTEVSSLGLPKEKPNLNSTCSFSVQNLILRGGGPNGNLQWPDNTPEECYVFTPGAKLTSNSTAGFQTLHNTSSTSPSEIKA